MGKHDVVLVNNSRETFTPTISGAIATCLWEVARAAADVGELPIVLTRPADAAPYPWPRTRFLAAPTPGAPEPVHRLARRATGWPTDRRAWARAVVETLAVDPPRTAICNNDPELAVLLARRLPGTRVLHWFHNLELARDRWRRAYLSSRVRSVAVSAYLARAVEQVYTLEPGYVHLAANGVDAVAFHPAATVPEGPLVLGYLGRIAPEKAPDTFLVAALILAERGYDIAVQLLGDTNWDRHEAGPFPDRVDDLLGRLVGAGVKVHAPGHVARGDVPHELRRAHIHVVPSAWDEPFGLTTLEGMATGLAVVATATGGTPEIVAGAGALVARGDATGLADALTPLVADPMRLDAARRAARRRAETFTWARTWARLHEAEETALTKEALP